MPSTTPDFSTVTAGVSSVRAGGAVGRADSRGCPRRRRGARRGATSPGRRRSVFGQASSNDAGGGSAGSGGGTAGGLGRRSADSRSGGNGSLVRACARSRSFRDVEENSRLRFGLTAGAASAGAALRRRRARGAPHPAMAVAAALELRRARCRRHLGGRLVAVNGKPLSPGAGARRCPAAVPAAAFAARLRHAGAKPPGDVLQFPDRHPEPEHDRAGANPDHAGQDQRIAEY